MFVRTHDSLFKYKRHWDRHTNSLADRHIHRHMRTHAHACGGAGGWEALRTAKQTDGRTHTQSKKNEFRQTNSITMWRSLLT